MEAILTRQIRVYGIVQGVGFRPTADRHARKAGITGTVCNYGPYVEIIAQGTAAQISAFTDALTRHPPRRAAILRIDVRDIDAPARFDAFSIIESNRTKGEIYISPDIAICEDCSRELFDPADRRYLHPFINCTCCGPRMTILDELPYDRERTSMKKFPMCPSCREEYENPRTRRYDAQPVCCPDCGPQVYLLEVPADRTDAPQKTASGRRPASSPSPQTVFFRRGQTGRAAITQARRTILSGGIVAVKGIGGFHLCCDAANEAAVTLLRQRKGRPVKPFAVMMRNYETVLRECVVLPGEEEILTGHQKPILLLQKRPQSCLCASIAPGNPTVGVMLPYAPVQLLLFDYDDGLVMPDCLVMTSGNPSGAPICRDDAEAAAVLGGLADCILSHDRDIRIRADDSVTDFFDGQPYMIRRSRGYAPLPFLLDDQLQGQVLAVGGELKNSFCLASGGLLYLSPYIGDMQDIRTVQAFSETQQRFASLLEIQPQIVACDLHPSYNSVRLAQDMGLPVIGVQHHYAHILSCMAENNHSAAVIGVSFDGTGYGTDGTIWGGELLLADPYGFTRLGSIRPFWQPGGDVSARDGWRIAVSMIYAICGDRMQALQIAAQLQLCDTQTARAQLAMIDHRINTVSSTSAGRLFDAVSAILGICRRSTFEGEASTALQYHAQSWQKVHPHTPVAEAEPVPEEPLLGADGFLMLPTDRLTADILTQKLSGEDTDRLAYIFHKRLAGQIIAAVSDAARARNIQTVALSGGVYQNRLLLELTVAGLRRQGFKVLTHHLVPPNDGGIALGQAMAALYQSQQEDFLPGP